VVEAEKRICELEKCEWALLTQSGMSAIDTALSIFQNGENNKPWLFFTEIYGGTNSYIDSVLVGRRGLDILTFAPDNGSYDLKKFEDILALNTPELIFLEVISNPLLIVADIEEIIRISGIYQCKVIIDNTFGTPHLLNPLSMGADLVIHSATKYLGGHGNITAGVVCGNNEDYRIAAVDYRKFIGHMLSADDAYRLTTQMETFKLRISQQFRNSEYIANLLDKSPVVEKVFFPSLEDHPTNEIARKQFGDRGYGAIITFDLAGCSAEEKRSRRDSFIAALSGKIRLIPTLGDSHTILMPVEPVWGYKYPEPGMIRLSVGFEETGQLADSISRALDTL
ncbi:MAG: PLP-dependent aspartate aminotransferase family protein, partial [Marinilabiliaceae bacterium]|nr:PLP-dependent aspartate aminotransferase family protein [Marinilabiliaceae bacterium]